MCLENNEHQIEDLPMLQEIVQGKGRLSDNLGPKVWNKRKK